MKSLRNNPQHGYVMQPEATRSYCYDTGADYFPITTHPEESFTSSYLRKIIFFYYCKDDVSIVYSFMFNVVMHQ